MTTQYMTTEEAAAFLKVKESRIRQLAIAGTITGIKRPNDIYRGKWYLETKSIYQYAAQRRKSGRPRTK